MKKEGKTPEPFWQKLVETFFKFCRENFNGEEPSFDKSSPRDLKDIIAVLKRRAEKQNIPWTEEEAVKRLWAFLDYANMDNFLHSTFILSNLNRFKDKVFFKTITPRTNGNNVVSSNTSQRPQTIRKPSGSFGQL